MPTIKIQKEQWGTIWKFLTKIGPVTRISKDYIYEISPQQLEALCNAGLPFETVKTETTKFNKPDVQYSTAV
ncbi:MAG: hypothetical protein FJ218_06235 [Ignavibacteria bacterium]|nr:hypothetical protein [Ignavibacteria bacterium]